MLVPHSYCQHDICMEKRLVMVPHSYCQCDIYIEIKMGVGATQRYSV